MAPASVPEDVNSKNMSGVYVLNRDVSDSPNDSLKLQNIGWVMRQGITRSNVEVTLKHFTDAEGKVHLDSIQLGTGGMKNPEERTLDWEWADTENWIWGKVKGRSRMVKLDQIDDEWIRQGWDQECVDGEVMESYVESSTDTWTAWQLWGFGVVDGVRRHMRRIITKKPGSKDVCLVMYYDWKEKA